jgi:hypothetical protein
MSDAPGGASASSPVVVSVRPQPDPAVLAAIVAAVEEAWPRPAVGDADAARPAPVAWRFSGRWWNQPVATSRQRPLVGH